ncbi:MAG: isocitrate/isopropylmalate dehydrogenase family protein [Anaerolineae bacterium]|nr:isocitrate/isopropylmalate dehydrogenase family protein [Anaerolineales bacterium]MCQ3975753.1 isocitrate/isopropylmalate dehydrogenase family protein [Anaerolineae bacterium]
MNQEKSVYTIAVIPGDGIGPEIISAACAVLQQVASIDNFTLNFISYEAGAGAYQKYGNALPAESLDGCRQADAIFKGPTGLPEVRLPDGTEAGVLGGRLRNGLDLYVNLRPIKLYPNVPSALANRQPGEIDWVMVRENTEGLYASRGNGVVATSGQAATDTLMITRLGTERIVRYAFEEARRRNHKKRVTCVDKSNVLRSFAFFRQIFKEIAQNYPDVEAETMYVDAAAQALVLEPDRFDVLVTENLFGDILSDLGGATVGGIGVCAGANIGDHYAYFEPIHGSAPRLAGTGRANPLAAILAGGLMLNYLGRRDSAAKIEQAIEQAFRQKTIILKPDGSAETGTQVVAEAIIKQLSA